MNDIPVGDMPPLHIHHAEDEGFYVLEGEVTLYLPEERCACAEGDFFLAPRGAPHTYRVVDAPAGCW